jgi:hypothetical protein
VLIYLAVADLSKLGAYFRKEEVMRIGAFVMAGLLALAVSTPASAATKKKSLAPTVSNFEACEKKALDLGLPHGQAGHQEYVRECMGQRPRNSRSTE